MKTQTTLVIAISALLASCGGSSGSDSVLAANDGFETPVFTPTPVNNGGTNTGGTDTGGTDTGGTDTGGTDTGGTDTGGTDTGGTDTGGTDTGGTDTGGTDTGGTDTGGTDTGGTDTGGTDTGGNIVIDDTSSAISELFGQFSLVYGFTGDEQVFILTSPFSATDVQLADDGSEVLFGTARFASRLTPDAEFVEGATQTLGCIFLGEIDNFLCLADVGERMESWYLFDRLVDDAALGTWEFCNGVEDCAAELVNAPDGDIVALVTPPAVASARSLELDQASKTDLIPYLQYLDQGTENSTITARSSTSEAGAIAAGVATLRESIK